MHTWHWHSWQELPYLSCSLLEQFPHGFFTQQFWSHTLKDMTEILHQEASYYRLKQVHGNKVLTPQEIEYKLSLGGDEVEQIGEKIFAKADGLISEQPLQAVVDGKCGLYPRINWRYQDRTSRSSSCRMARYRKKNCSSSHLSDAISRKQTSRLKNCNGTGDRRGSLPSIRRCCSRVGVNSNTSPRRKKRS